MQVEDRLLELTFEDEPISDEDKFHFALKESVNSIIRKEGYISYSMEKKKISTNGSNFVGVLYNIDIKGKTVDGEKETNLFIKRMITSDKIVLMSIPEAFSRELFAYKELLNIYTKLQDEADIPLEDRYNKVKSYDESNSEVMILDNAVRKGFKTLNRHTEATLKFLELSVQQLGKLHALSYVLQKKRPEYFEKYLKPIQHLYALDKCEDWKILINIAYNIVLNYLEEDVRIEFDKACPDIYDEYLAKLKSPSRVSCLCHGDYWASNILAKFTNGEVTEVIPIDYQMMYYGNPMQDFFYLIFCATNQKQRNDHLEDLKEMYYNAFKQFLNYFCVDAEAVHPRKEFEENYEDTIAFGYIKSIITTPFLMANEEDEVDFTKETPIQTHTPEPRIQSRIRGLADEFLKLKTSEK